MDPQRWKRIDSLIQDALSRPPEEREAFLRSACEGDEELLREVRSLLKSQQMAGNFLDGLAIEVAARDLAAGWTDDAPPNTAFRNGQTSSVAASPDRPRCRACSFPIPHGARYCAGCAIPIASEQRRDTNAVPPHAVTPSPEDGQFSLGTILAGRYTLLGLAGRGGMGEVYRARDNKLDQVVALKLLTGPRRGSTAALIALHKEVRLARQVSHPNVCRVYDIGESDGLHFLTMEFIDGDDLARLLRRIGRFPHDKGVEIARRICGALAAAHERGVLHRDLKPANVMLTAAGHVVVTDFGLAMLVDELKSVQSRSGTPAYMAPEQAAGGKVSVRSDIYSLGLVLYELFTGRSAFEGGERGSLTRPSALVKDLDPDVERVILRCLAEDPEDRPPAALAVAALLPGGDPLQVALAEGRTPPPEMVAAFGEKAGITVPSAVWCLAVTLTALLAVLRFSDRPQVLTRAPLEVPPDALAVKARELAASVGYPGRPRGLAFGFWYDAGQIRRLERQGWSDPALSRPSPVRFWYRESPRGLASYEMKGLAWNDPPRNSPGMISMQFDGAGRLTFFRALPIDAPFAGPRRDPDWSTLLASAALDLHSLREVAPRLQPPGFADSRFAWTASYAGRPEACIRVEAAALAGRPVYFRLISAWEADTVEPENLDVAFQITARPHPPSYPGTVLGLLIILALGVSWVAWRNVNSGRGDRSGAFRVAVLVFALWMVYGISVGFGQLQGAPERSWMVAANALFWAATAWVFYIAMEPLVRRTWPHSLVSWSRLLSGQWRDPLVGRDILIGILVMSCFFLLRTQLPITIGSAVPARLGAFIAILPVSLAASASGTLFAAVFFTLSLAILRRKWAAFLLTSIFLSVMNFFLAMPGRDWLQVWATSMYSVVMVAVLIRFGVLACYSAMATSYILFALPLGLDFNAWYQDAGRIGILILASLAVFGFHSALAGRRVLREHLV